MKNNKNHYELKKEIIKIKEEVRVGILGPLAASFGFVIALVWRDAIQSAIREFLTRRGITEQAYLFNFIFALLVTIIVIIIIFIIKKISKKRTEKEIKKIKR